MPLSASAVRALKQPIDSLAPTREIRRVKDLKWAELREYGPFPEKNRARNQRRCVKAGHSYERTVHRELKRIGLDGEICFRQWIMFADSNGLGWAQPDIYILLPNLILLMECKLTQSRDAEPQLLNLYLPLLRSIYQSPILALQVCKNLRTVPPKLVDGPEDLLQFPGPGVHTWHYIGN